MKNILVFTITIFLGLTACVTQKERSINTVTIPIDKNTFPENAFIYSLPKTVIQINVKLACTTYKAGPFKDYAQNYLNIPPTIQDDKSEWQILSIDAETKGIPNNDEQYALIPQKKSAPLNISLTQEGVLMGMNLSNTDFDNSTPSVPQTSQPVQPKTITFNDVPLLEKQIKTASMATMAESCANMIYKLRKRRLKLLGYDYPQHPADGASLTFATESLKQQEQQFTELFLGKTVCDTIIQSFELIPETKSDQKILFYFSTESGLTQTPTNSTVEYTAEYNYTKNYSTSDTNDKKVSKGVIYILPSKIDFTIKEGEKTMFYSNFFVSQNGLRVSLPNNFKMTDKTQIKLNQTNGALHYIK